MNLTPILTFLSFCYHASATPIDTGEIVGVAIGGSLTAALLAVGILKKVQRHKEIVGLIGPDDHFSYIFPEEKAFVDRMNVLYSQIHNLQTHDGDTMSAEQERKLHDFMNRMGAESIEHVNADGTVGPVRFTQQRISQLSVQSLQALETFAAAQQNVLSTSQEPSRSWEEQTRYLLIAHANTDMIHKVQRNLNSPRGSIASARRSQESFTSSVDSQDSRTSSFRIYNPDIAPSERNDADLMTEKPRNLPSSGSTDINQVPSRVNTASLVGGVSPVPVASNPGRRSAFALI